MLRQNRPIPFNPSSNIRFELPAAGPARLRVYGAGGRLLRTLVDGRLAAGAHERLWDGRDDGGRRVAAGVYSRWLTTPDGQATRKMVLIEQNEQTERDVSIW